MEKQRPAWVKDVKAFVGFTLLNAALVWAGIGVAVGFGWGQAGIACLWVFAFPWSAAIHLGWDSRVVVVLFFANYFIYGLAWWGAWRAVKLLRTKPAE